jgi:hypothetical protein
MNDQFDDFTKGVLKPLSDGVNRVKTHDATGRICGIGFVVLLPQYSKAEYVAKCFKNNVLTIITDRNEIIQNCYVSREVWQYVKFPTTNSQKGSMIFWINPPHENKPFIISVILKRDELLDSRNENSFCFKRSSDNGAVTIEGLDNGILNILLSGESDLDGKVNINILNAINEGLFKLYIQGNINIECDDTISFKIRKGMKVQIIDEDDNTKQANISYLLGEGFKYTDEFNNEIDVNKDGGDIIVDKGNKVKIHEINANIEPMLLGNKTEDVLISLHDMLTDFKTVLKAALLLGSFVPFAALLSPQVVLLDAQLVVLSEKIKLIKSKTVELS